MGWGVTRRGVHSMSARQKTSAWARAGVLSRECGNVLILSVLLATLVTALATAQFFTVQKNLRSSNYSNDRGKLRAIAESGIYHAVYELGYRVGNGDGTIGTVNWVSANDLGRDGKANTKDEGEKDERPSPGEPNVSAVSVGKAGEGISFFTRATDTKWAGVKRVISTAFNATATSTVEVYVKLTPVNMAGVGAVYVLPGTVLDLNGNSFTISGKDTNPDGTTGTAAAVYGIATLLGSPPGTNTTNITTQVSSKSYAQITGMGSTPSIGETTGLDFNAIYNAFKSAPHTTVNPGTVTSPSWGDYATNDYRITYCPGDLHLSGTGQGAGALVVDGSLTMSGSFTYVGLIIVKGDVQIVC